MHQIFKHIITLFVISIIISCNKSESLQRIEIIEGTYVGKMEHNITEIYQSGLSEVFDTVYDASANIELVGNDSISFKVGEKMNFVFFKRDTNYYQTVYDAGEGGLTIEVINDTLKYTQAFSFGDSGGFSRTEVWAFEGNK